MMNKGGGSGAGIAGSGGGSGPTAAAAAAALQKQKTLLQRVDTDITSVVDNFAQIVNVVRVSDFFRFFFFLSNLNLVKINSIEDYHSRKSIGKSLGI